MTTVPERIRMWATAHPDRPFLVEAGGRTLSYGEFHDESLVWAAAYRMLGLVPGDNVVTLVRPSAAAYASWLGMAWLKVVDVGCNTDYHGSMLAYLVRQSRSRVALVDASYVSRLVEIATELPGLEVVVVLGGDAGEVDMPFRVVAAEDLLAGLRPLDVVEPPSIWDIAMMTYTSGTTGPSKGVLLPWAQVQGGCLGLIPPDDLDETDSFYSPFPMFHSSGRAALCLMSMHGGRVVIREGFSATHYWDDIKGHGCTTTGLVGAMTAFLWNQPVSPDDADNPLKRAVMFPVVPYFREFQERFGVKLSTMYATTEIGPAFCSGWNITDHTSCGTRRDEYEVRLVDEHDFEVPVGEVGELIVRHRYPWALNQGYFDMPDKTVDAWRNGWFHTGDAFRCDEEGRYYFVDRIKDALRRRGENISSFEVEGLVNAHPGVLESAVVAVPSEWGEDEIKVCVVRGDGALTEERLVRDLIGAMPRFMVPRYVEMVDSLPKTEATQRVKKHLLRVDPLNGRTWDREAAGIEIPK